jgi:haloalkane dehalogenase
MKYKRTPDTRFENLKDYSFEPHYLSVDDTEGGELRVHYLDEGPAEAPVVLLMHGQPAWSYLYRHMIPLLLAEGFRVVVPDLIISAQARRVPLYENSGSTKRFSAGNI